MKLVCKAFANSKFAVMGGELIVDKDGILEIEDQQDMVSTITMLMRSGFEELKETSSEESKEEEPKEKTKKRYSRKQP